MVSIIIPTYQERENLQVLVGRIFQVLKAHKIVGEVVIVDDDSPDGTSEVARELASQYNLRVLIRKDERGLATAVLRGFEEAQYDTLCVMDADLSHPPEKLPDLISPVASKQTDMAIGSRYIDGGGLENWPWKRKWISKAATLLAKPLSHVKDPMSGFFCINREVLHGKNFAPKGYKIALELLVRGKYTEIIEVPFVFTDRNTGSSNFGFREQLNYLQHLGRLYKVRWPIAVPLVKSVFIVLLTLLILRILYEL